MRLQRFALFGTGLLVFCFAGYMAEPFVGHRDRFPFLAGRAPRYSGVVPGFRTLGESTRIYVWQGDVADARKEADRDLRASGFIFTPDCIWEKRKGGKMVQKVWITPARIQAGTHFMLRSVPGWVSVIVSEPLGNSPIDHLRYALAPTR